MIAAIHHAMYAVVGQLIGNHHAAVAQNTAVHMELDIRADVFRLERPFFFDESGFGFSQVR